ncbi:MAG: phosphatase PAP2 family protein [Desulfobacterales bacterium]|nr:phosphatase PAP2 family protein [Desulfobacterales bacterium]
MKSLRVVFLVMILLILPSIAWTEEGKDSWEDRVKNTIYEDYKNFYSIGNLEKLAIGLGAAGVLANTSADREIQDRYQESVRNKDTDNLSTVTRMFGEGVITIPVYLGAALFGEFAGDVELSSTTGEWGKRCLRTLLVGAPPALFLQRALGAPRPDEGGSGWSPFSDNNGVSGHSFNGAVPFITAAKMTDNPYYKYGLYFASALGGISRINDNAHYFSQAALGWWMAYLAVASMDKTGTKRPKIVVTPAAIPNGVGVMAAFHF